MICAILNCGAHLEVAFSNKTRKQEFQQWFRDIVRALHAERVHVVIMQEVCVARSSSSCSATDFEALAASQGRGGFVTIEHCCFVTAGAYPPLCKCGAGIRIGVRSTWIRDVL